MKKINMFSVAAVALALVLSSCEKDNAGVKNPSAEKINVTLSFKNSATRADGATAVANATVEILDGYICFTTVNNAITDVYTITSAPTADKNIQNTALGTTPVVLSNIPGASSKVYMIVNKGTHAALAVPQVGSSINTYSVNNMKVEDQSDYLKVTSSGSAILVDGSASDMKNASISLSTQVSRIQIKGITFEGNITGNVAGIFINGYYPTMQLNGTAGVLTSSKSSVDYDENGAGTVFPSTLDTYIFDKVNKTIGATVVPNTANGVWGYNLFASKTPQIIIKLTDVVVDGQTLSASQFVTINGFKNGTEEIENLAGGMIYTINTDALVIKHENMSTDPGVTPLQVSVNVTPVTWQETTVIPNM